MTSADFAEAQKRVAARRRNRAAAARGPTTATQSSSLPSALPAPLGSAAQWLQPYWNIVSGREGTGPAFRVGQVDAELLDEELLDLFKGQVGEALKYYGPHLRDDWSAEILLALRAVLFKLTLWDHNASYGASLQNLQYTDARVKSVAHAPPARWQKMMYGLLSVGGRYAWTKWEDRMLDAEGGYDEPSPLMRRLSRLSSLASTTHSVAAFASFLVFLVNGRYRTILDRILRLRLLPTTSQVSREVSFEYLNRQLVWHAFTEFLLFLLPLVGISRWRRWLTRAWRKMRSLIRRGGDEDEDIIPAGELGFLPERTCAICYQDQNPAGASESDVVAMSGSSTGVVGSAQTDITNPYETIPCGCVYCFVCLAQRLDAEDGEGWTCLRCGEVVKECRPWHGDLVQERSRPSSGKSVSFADNEKEDARSDQMDESFARVDPVPLEDEREAQLESQIEEEIEQSIERRESLEDSAAWGEGDDSFVDGTEEEFDPSASLVRGSAADDE